MKRSLFLPVVLFVVVFGALAGAALSHRGREPASRTSNVDLARIEERLAALESRLGEISKVEAELERLAARENRELAEPASESVLVPPKASGEPPPVRLEAAQIEDSAPRSKLDTWLDSQGMRQDLEDFVAKVYEQARSSRKDKERVEAEERDREMRELSEGPYGKFNFRVNSLAKKLELDARQKDYLYNLLSRYEEKRREMESQSLPADRKPTPEELEQHFKHLARINQDLSLQFQDEFQRGLNPSQQEIYRSLPEDERGPDRDQKRIALEGIRAFAVKGDAVIEAAPGAVEKVFQPKAVPVPRN